MTKTICKYYVIQRYCIALNYFVLISFIKSFLLFIYNQALNLVISFWVLMGVINIFKY